MCVCVCVFTSIYSDACLFTSCFTNIVFNTCMMCVFSIGLLADGLGDTFGKSVSFFRIVRL